MIIERPLRSKLDIQSFNAVENNWETWISDATSLVVKRGGRREGLGVKTDVGLLTFSLHNAQDPLDGGTFYPGQPVRVVSGDYIPAYDETVYSWGFESYEAIEHPSEQVYSEGFEVDEGGWLPYPGAEWYAWRGTSYPHTGVGALNVYRYDETTPPTPAGAKRTITGLLVGHPYTVSGWARHDSGASFSGMTGSIGVTGKSKATQALPSAPHTYIQVSYTFTATATSHEVFLECDRTDGGDEAWGVWDDITVTRNAWTEVFNDGLDGGEAAYGHATDARAHTGTYSVQTDYYTKPFTLNTNHEYTFNAWVYTDTPQDITIVATDPDGMETQFVSVPIPGGVWSQASGTFLPSTETSVFVVLPGTDDIWIDDIELVEHVAAVDNRTPIFTGRIAHFGSTYPMDKSTGKSRTVVTVTVADAVQIHGSTMRYGVDLGPDGFETFEERISRLETSANAPVDVPPIGAPIVRYAL